MFMFPTLEISAKEDKALMSSGKVEPAIPYGSYR
jgi:hypothetical protein